MEAALRMPVLAALGRLRIDPAVAEKVLRAALEVCQHLMKRMLATSCCTELSGHHTDLLCSVVTVWMPWMQHRPAAAGCRRCQCCQRQSCRRRWAWC